MTSLDGAVLGGAILTGGSPALYRKPLLGAAWEPAVCRPLVEVKISAVSPRPASGKLGQHAPYQLSRQHERKPRLT